MPDESMVFEMQPLDERTSALLRQVHVNLPWRYLSRYLPLVLEHRLNVELGFEAFQLDQCGFDEFREVAEKLEEAGCSVTLHGPFWDLSPGSPDPLIRQVSRLRLSQFFDLLPVFQPLQVVCHTGFDPRHHGAGRGEWLDRAIRIWEPLVVRAEQLKIPFLIENVWEWDPGLHRILFDRLPSPYLGFCLDVGHQHSFSDSTLTVWLQALVDQLCEIHVHDNDGGHDDHLPVGMGTIDFPLLFKFLEDHGKRPLLTLEPHRAEHLVETLITLTKILPGTFLGK